MHQRDSSIPESLRLHPGQDRLTPEQEAEARRFAAERIQAQLSTEPVDEQEVEAILRQFYQIVKLPPPRIQWLDNPLQLVALTAPPTVWRSNRENVHVSLGGDFNHHIDASFRASRGNKSVSSIWNSLRTCLRHWMWENNLQERLRRSICHSIRASILDHFPANIEDSLWGDINESYQNSIQAYFSAPWLSLYLFCDIYLAPNDMVYLARFNERVSGYRLGTEGALIVRRPLVIAHDEVGHLHSAIGRAIEYPNDWGLYVWHGVRVPERVIMAPETLTREDFLGEKDIEVRRLIQERMDERFVPELGGVIIDNGPRGTLYEVELPGDPERIARYVQVQDASTARQYFVRVPPTIRTAAEAVAWSFTLSVEEYNPVQET
jgi:Domain of unknown function (DUF6745)